MHSQSGLIGNIKEMEIMTMQSSYSLSWSRDGSSRLKGEKQQKMIMVRDQITSVKSVVTIAVVLCTAIEPKNLP